jgi:hypothetical protein
MNEELHTPLRESYLVTGARFTVATNSEEILAAARKCFRQTVGTESSPVLTMRLWVDPTAHSSPRWPPAYFRCLNHLVYAGLDDENVLLLDLQRRRVIGRLSRSMAQDQAYWQRVLFPAIVGLASETLNVTVLHCGCVERDGMGLLLAGKSRSGKSTLSLALAQNGFAFLSDDWTYLSLANRRLCAWGLATPVKLLPDALAYFHQLRAAELSVSFNGELAYEVDPEHIFGIRRSLRCEPRWLIFLERQESPGHSFLRISPEQAATSLESELANLPPELSRFRETQQATIRSLVEHECWLLRYGENPQEVAQVLSDFCLVSQPSLQHGFPKSSASSVRMGPDLIGRFTPTPFTADLSFAEHPVRFETNSRIVLQRMGSALKPAPKRSPEEPFVWRLVIDGASGLEPPWPDFSQFAVDGLLLANIGQRNFLAVDTEARRGVGFVAEELVHDPAGFEAVLLPRLCSMTSLRTRWASLEV